MDDKQFKYEEDGITRVGFGHQVPSHSEELPGGMTDRSRLTFPDGTAHFVVVPLNNVVRTDGVQ